MYYYILCNVIIHNCILKDIQHMNKITVWKCDNRDWALSNEEAQGVPAWRDALRPWDRIYGKRLTWRGIRILLHQGGIGPWYNAISESLVEFGMNFKFDDVWAFGSSPQRKVTQRTFAIWFLWYSERACRRFSAMGQSLAQLVNATAE